MLGKCPRRRVGTPRHEVITEQYFIQRRHLGICHAGRNLDRLFALFGDLISEHHAGIVIAPRFGVIKRIDGGLDRYRRRELIPCPARFFNFEYRKRHGYTPFSGVTPV